MRKKFLLLLIVALFVGIMPVAAQDEEEVEETPACTEEELGIVVPAISELGNGFAEITALAGDGSDPEAISGVVLGIDAIATGFWNEIYPELPDCVESNVLSLNFGLVLDEALINAGLLRLTMYEAEHGDPEVAAAYGEYVAARSEWFAAVVDASFGEMAETGEIPESMYGANLPECTEEDEANETVTAFMDSLASFEEMSGAVSEEPTPEELTALIGGYAVLSSTHWIEVYPALPCAEISELAHVTGMIYDGTLISLLMTRLALYEAEFGVAETAELYLAAAEARVEMTDEFVSEVFGDEEGEDGEEDTEEDTEEEGDDE